MILSIEGNIGSGKTELLNALEIRHGELVNEMKHSGSVVLNLHKRTFPKGIPTLKIIPEELPPELVQYYKGEFNVVEGEKLMINVKLAQWEKAKEAAKNYDIVLVDSCPLSSLAFLHMLKVYHRGQSPLMFVDENNTEALEELQRLEDMVEDEIFPFNNEDGEDKESFKCLEDLDPCVDRPARGNMLRGVIHMITPPIVCKGRIQKRAREGESTIDLAGLTNLHSSYITILKENGYYHSSRISSCGDVDMCLEDIFNLYAFQ